MEWATPLNTLSNWFSSPPKPPPRRRKIDDDWIDLAPQRHHLDPTVNAMVLSHLPPKKSEDFKVCLGKFRELVYMDTLEDTSFSKTLLVALKNAAEETQTFALRLLKVDHLSNPDEGKKYFYLQRDFMGYEWERFHYDDRLVFAIARRSSDLSYHILHRYKVTNYTKNHTYKLIATFSLYDQRYKSTSDPFLKKETVQALQSALPKRESERFCFCLANTLPDLTIQGFLGKGSLSTVYLANYRTDQEYALAFRISNTDKVIQRYQAHLPNFQITSAQWGSEFNAFLVDDPYMLDTHYAIVWSDRHRRYLVLDKYQIQKEKKQRSGDTFTLYATLSPFLEGSKTLDQSLKDRSDPIDASFVRNFSTQLLLALANLPEGISHRDLKPQNILVTKDGVLKLIDFGFSSSDQKEAAGGDIRGTPLTLAPELFLGQSFNLHKTDIYSFYAVLHWVIYQTYPIDVSHLAPFEQASAWKQQLIAYGQSDTAPSSNLSAPPFQMEERERKQFLDFIDHIGHSKPEKRWTAQRLLEEECFLRSQEKPPTPPKKEEVPWIYIPPIPPHIEPSPSNNRLIIQITLGVGSLLLIRFIAKKIIEAQLRQRQTLPQPHKPQKV